MAPRKQPIRLEESALKVVANYCADAVVYRLENCNAEDAESYITLVKDYVCVPVLEFLFNDFAAMFLQRISEVRRQCTKDYVDKFGTAVFDVIVDDRLTKLEPYPLVDTDLMHQLFGTMDRLRNLRYLDLGSANHEYLSNLRNCNLENLTTFVCHNTCNDEILHLISERSPNLTTLDIEESKRITPAGLGVLKLCTKLSVVKLEGWYIQANDLITHLLGHDTIENIAYSLWDVGYLKCFGAGVYPQLKSLRLNVPMDITNAALDIIVRSFPDLNTLFLRSDQITGDLRLLRSLRRLTLLHVWFRRGDQMKQLESLLTEVGNNYLSFSFGVVDSQVQQLANIVYKTCKNLKYFKVYVLNVERSHTITIPPFENLESLSVQNNPIFWNCSVHLRFTRLLALKKLHLSSCNADLESILRDHDNFPCITEVIAKKCGLHRSEHIRKMIKEGNFDVRYECE